MTEQEQRIAIAEWEGLKNPRLENWAGCGSELQAVYTHVAKQVCHGETTQLCPVYDLNDMNIVEAKLPPDKLFEFRERLSDLLEDECRVGLAVHAKADKRRQALLRIIGKWKETP